jgi:uncharacterized protein YlxP (DUF503 family)
MVVSMLQVIIELPEASSLKDKRSLVSTAKRRLQHRFHLSIAEVDLQDSIRFAQLGAALVSNSREFGEKVLGKALSAFEDELDLRVFDAQIHSETF